ncbi:MAG: hypothetical protein NHB14_20735 [Desulfosporosinus sp.]|nr:hypothetical protein [Desulfosporosinus sp.]
MAGTYLEGTSKVLSGVYTIIQAAIARVTMGARGIVAYPFTSDWGPVNSLETVITETEFKSKYNGAATALTAASVYVHAFNGKPQRVLCYRMATAAAAKGTVILNDDVAGASLTLETLYPSARAFTAVVKAGVSATKLIEILEGGVKLVSVEGNTVAELTAKLNVTDYVRVTAQGAELPADNAGVAFAGGNNGVSTEVEYAAFLDEIEADGTPSAFSLDAVSDDAILVLARDWVKRVRQEGIYITFVQGGPVGWDTAIATANAKSLTLNHKGIINVGNGADGYTAAEMAVFVAARVASVPLNMTLTDEVTPYVAVNKKLKPGERVTAKESGTVVFVQDGNVVLIDEAVNTLTTPPIGEMVEMGKIRVNNALDYIAKDLEKFGDEYKRTRSNTQEARETYAATVENSYLKPLTNLEVIQEGYYYRPDPDYHGKDATVPAKIDEAFFYGDITPVDSMERIYQKINVHF